MTGQTAILGAIWHNDALALSNKLEKSFRLAIHGGAEAASRSIKLDQHALTVLTAPSNHRIKPKAGPANAYQADGLMVVADAWLLNCSALLNRLGLPPLTSPAQLIGQLYRAEGEDGLDLIDGDFAFVIYDARSDKAIMRRDPFGVRPLYWAALQSGGFAFSSLPETIPNAGLIDTKRDIAGLLDLLSRSAADRSETLVKGLNRVPPGTQVTFMVARPDPASRKYWSPVPQSGDVPDNFDGWTTELRRLMDKAVQSRIPAAGDLAASISSGLDSTSVTMLAERHLADDQHIFTSTYAASEQAEAAYPGMLDETKVASGMVAHSNRISWEKIRLKPKAGLPEPRLAAVAWDTEGNEDPEFATAIRAVEHGADVILTGWGGDNVVSYKGYGVPSALLKSGKWSALKDVQEHSVRNGKSAWKFHARTVFDAMFPAGSAIREALKGPSRDTRNFNHRLMTGLRSKYRDRGPLSEHRNSDTRSNKLKDITSPVLAFRLEILTCHGLRSGIRYVHPMLDQKLIAFALTCPPEYEFRDGMYRAPIRAAMAGILPDIVRLRTETGYPLVEAALQIAHNKQDYLEKLDLLETDRRLHKYFDFSFVRTHLQRLPSIETAEQHIAKVSTSGQKLASPVNLSIIAVTAMATVQAALDEESWRD